MFLECYFNLINYLSVTISQKKHPAGQKLLGVNPQGPFVARKLKWYSLAVALKRHFFFCLTVYYLKDLT